MSETTLLRVLTATNARNIWPTFRKLHVGKHASTAKLHSKTKFTSKNARMGLVLKSTSTALEYLLHGTVLLEEQCPSMIELCTRESSLRLRCWNTSSLTKLESGIGASVHPPWSHRGRTHHRHWSCWIKYPHKRPRKKTGKFPQKKGHKKDSDKFECACATMHRVHSVMARAGPDEWILHSGASTHTTGMKSLLKDYKEVATTIVTLANGDILPAEGVGAISIKNKRGESFLQMCYT